jgi:hypothetical protein
MPRLPGVAERGRLSVMKAVAAVQEFLAQAGVPVTKLGDLMAE